jgi:hypothetical protein
MAFLRSVGHSLRDIEIVAWAVGALKAQTMDLEILL